MESPQEIRASLGVAALADLVDHEDTFPEGEAWVARLLSEAGVLSWPLVVDAESGLILDGSHRAHVLEREYGARFVPVQQVRLEHPSVRIASWCRILEGIAPDVFGAARARLGLRPGAAGGLACHYGNEVYGMPGVTRSAAYEVACRLEAELATNGHAPRRRFVEDDEAERYLGQARTVVLRLPALDKETVRARAGNGRFPAKSTRFLLPYRVVGLALPLAMLASPRDALEARLDAARSTPLLCLGEGLCVDRRYPERLWQFADYRIPSTLFTDAKARAAYEAAIARATPAIS